MDDGGLRKADLIPCMLFGILASLFQAAVFALLKNLLDLKTTFSPPIIPMLPLVYASSAGFSRSTPMIVRQRLGLTIGMGLLGLFIASIPAGFGNTWTHGIMYAIASAISFMGFMPASRALVASRSERVMNSTEGRNV